MSRREAAQIPELFVVLDVKQGDAAASVIAQAIVKIPKLEGGLGSIDFLLMINHFLTGDGVAAVGQTEVEEDCDEDIHINCVES